MQYKEIMDAAAQARINAYAPYSKFTVGAALLTKTGKIFAGSNIENISLGLTICAERSAVANAISNGSKDLEAIAIVANSPEPAMPCGACRQVLVEFNPDLVVVVSTTKGDVKEFRLSELLPRPTHGILGEHRDV